MQNNAQEMVLVIDFGGQYNQLIARRVRESGVYCEIVSYKHSLEAIKAKNPKGIIFTGGPNSAYLEDSPTIDPEIYTWGVPVLGICYGSQLMMHMLGGHVCVAPEREYGKTVVDLDTTSPMFAGLSEKNVCWMSHNDYIETAAPGFKIVASTPNCPVAAAEDAARKLYCVQFHPEVLHTENGTKMLSNFVYNVCGCAGTWKMDSFVEQTVAELKERIGDGKVLCALSGGVDSSVCAAMLAKAIGKQLTCVFVDHGLLRKNEREEVCAVFGEGGQFDINFICVDARERFYSKLAGVTAPEGKRKIIGEEFVEPLRDLFKDEVRQSGRELGLPENLVARQPFPGPGLAIRIIGDVTPEKVAIVQDADAIYREEVDKLPMSERPSQYFAALTNMRSVGVMGDERTYDYAIALRAVTTTDFMTAEVTMLPPATITTAANRIVNEVKHINRVLFDYTTKPPATIEFE